MRSISTDAPITIAATTIGIDDEPANGPANAAGLAVGRARRNCSSHEAYSAANVCSERGSLRSTQAAVGCAARISHGVSSVVMPETATAIE